MRVDVNKPVGWYVAIGFVVTWMAEKLQVLPEYLNWFGMGYWIMLVILVGLAFIPSTRVIKDGKESIGSV